MSDTEQELGTEIARARHGQDVTASDLANRLMPWLKKHDAELTERVRAEQREADARIAESEVVRRSYSARADVAAAIRKARKQ